ncbi:hypothetical protein K469DRAFT_705744 [Zopfia rhizophila CBS 207.26]|uniref:F-box domain-containing protein n=1 Tax=Zopfia rhizophila CBS 207.26 TaxID=1314779 RepID=A0A6A6E5U4_9PEZI|nr:hypothetical protein K469DRAFT_705744 [Zopfia rhizophila CBS 207.26]
MQQPQAQATLSSLPTELFLHILDQLVGTRDGHNPVAYSQSDPITKSLRSLTLVSKGLYPTASQYLYTHCLYLDNCTSFSRFRRTLGFDLGYHSQALKYGQPGRNEKLFSEAVILKHITSLFISPLKTERDKNVPMIRLPQVIDVCNTIGPTLRRLALDLCQVYSPASEVESIKPHIEGNDIFRNMLNLEELVASYDITDYFVNPPQNLKRLAVSTQETGDAFLKFCFGIERLETLMFLRDPELEAGHVEAWLEYYKGEKLDIVLIDVSANHRTPEGTREWEEEDRVKVWEVDVPKSYYGDEEDLLLCDSWMWEHAVRGTLWNQDWRRMESWGSVRERVRFLEATSQQS